MENLTIMDFISITPDEALAEIPQLDLMGFPR